MGRVGRKRKPQALKDAQGNPGKQRRRQEPQAPDGVIRCPQFLDPVAKRRFQALAPMLREMGLLKATDVDALASYCTSYSIFREADKAVGRTAADWPMRQVAMRARKDALAEMRAGAAQFGLTPSARAQMTVGEQGDGPKDAFDELARKRAEINRKARGSK